MLGALGRRLRYLLRRDRASADLAEEMQMHVALREEAMRRDGLDPVEARFAAQRRFGNRTAIEQQSRAAWGLGSADQLAQDLRYAARRLRHRPSFAAAVVGVLALGIGATTAMFSAVDAAILRPLPFADPDRLVTIRGVTIPFGEESRASDEDHWALDIIDVDSMRSVFSQVAAYATGGLNLADSDRPQRVKVGVVTAGMFATLGVAPMIGRTFSADEGRPDGPAVVVLSYDLWMRQFAGNVVLGQKIQLGARLAEIIGVMPRGFGFPGESDLWVPMSIPTTRATFEPFRGWLPATVIGRLTPGLSLEAARLQVRARWDQLGAARSRSSDREELDELIGEIDRKGSLAPLQRELAGDRRTALLVLLGATGLLLLIACANVTNLLFSQAALRRREMAMREVLGATRRRLVRQLLIESLTLAVSGAALGILLALAALSVMRAIMPAELAGVAPAQVDLRVLAFAAGLALVTGVGFGLWPALGGTRERLGETIKSGGGPGTTVTGARHARRLLLVVEIALTATLLVGAGLMVRSFERVAGADAGMNPARVGTLELSFVRGTPAAVRLARINEILTHLSAVPGIEATAVVNDLPLRGGGGLSVAFDVDGVPAPKGGEPRFARWLMASSDYFKALGVPILRGRPFAVTDDSLAPRVAIISRTMATRFWPNTDPVGRTLHAGAPNDPPATVIGIVADVRERDLEQRGEPQMYFPVSATTPDRLAVVARSSLPPNALLSRMVAAVRTVDRTQAVYNVRMLEDVVGASMAPRRTNTLLISAFAILALALASLGVYAVVAHAIAQRSRELGVRAALGATPGALVALVTSEMLWVTTVGLAVGIAGALALSRVMSSLLYGIDARDAATFATVPVVLVLAAGAATIVPAWRARRVDLVHVLRTD